MGEPRHHATIDGRRNRALPFGPLLLALLLASCGGSGGSGGGGSGGGGPSTPVGTYYVDASGGCAGRQPCYTTLRAAVSASFESQFEVSGSTIVRAKRPNDPPDQIIVMPGTHRSSPARDWVLLVGLNGESFPPGIWKLRLIAEQGPGLTTISGDGTGPCIWITDHVDLEIRGFTVTGCAIAQTGLVNEHHAVYINSWSQARVRLEGNHILSNADVAAIGVKPYNAGFRDVDIQIVRNRLVGNHAGVLFEGFPVIPSPQDTARFVVANNVIADGSTVMSPLPTYGIAVGLGTTRAVQNIHIDVLHNTVVGQPTGILVNTDSGNTNVQNNIVFGNRIDIYGGSAFTTRNLVGETSNLSSGGNVVGNPLFVDAANGNYGLQQSSPAIDAGADSISVEVTRDYNGTLRPQDGDRNGTAVADIGAIETVP